MKNERRTGYGNVLLIRFSAIGDVAMSVPVVLSLAKSFPDTCFTFLTSVRFLPFFRGLPPNATVIGVDLKKDYRGRGGVRRLFRMLEPMGFDAVADLHGVLRTFTLGMMFRLHGVPVRSIRKNRLSRYSLTRLHFKDLSRRPASWERYCRVLERLGFRFRLEFTSLFPPGGGDMKAVSSFVGDKVTPWVGVAPFAAHKGKIYPLELMERVVAEIDSSGPCRQFIFAYGGERELVSGWEAKYPSVSLIDTRLGIEGELVLISHLDVMLSMDSSNMHIASLTGTPVVSVWGATHPAAGFLGYGQKEEDCVQLGMKCRPCSVYGKKRCRYGDYRCLTGIAPDTVTAKVLAYLPSQQVPPT
ncbi:MAG: glycosyltransferase family 9 protein [Bacteroidaceae bacterium]|nr:glycosyltransferase family 9 protein [Bacteroidaceae bacterium]